MNKKEKHKKIVNYWEKNLYKEHNMHEWDMGCDFSEATEWCWRCGIDTSRLEMCHIIPKQFLPEDIKEKFDPSNLVLLCPACHKEAPDVNDKKIMWKWIKETSFGTPQEYKENRISIEYEKLYGCTFLEDLKKFTKQHKELDKQIYNFMESDEYKSDLNTKMSELYEKDIGIHSNNYSWSSQAVVRKKCLDWHKEYVQKWINLR